jgi:hypothetical protein
MHVSNDEPQTGRRPLDPMISAPLIVLSFHRGFTSGYADGVSLCQAGPVGGSFLGQRGEPIDRGLELGIGGRPRAD